MFLFFSFVKQTLFPKAPERITAQEPDQQLSSDLPTGSGPAAPEPQLQSLQQRCFIQA